MAKKTNNKQKNLRRRKAIAGYMFIAPFLIGFIAFMIMPFLESLRMSFSNVIIGAGQGGFKMDYIGIKNFKDAFLVDSEFTRFLTEELTKMAVQVPTTVIVSLFMALLIDQNFKGRTAVRAIFFLPVILSSGVLVGLEYDNTLVAGLQDYINENSQLTSVTATLEQVLSNSGLGTRFLDQVYDIINNVYDVIMASGVQIIIYLAGLQSVTDSMYEAADIEGCTRWESFWKITLPMVSPMILVNIIYSIVDFFMRSDSEIMTKISDTMIIKMDYGFSSAMAWVYFVAVMLIIGISTLIISRWVHYYED